MPISSLTELRQRFFLHQPTPSQWPDLDWRPSGVLIPIRECQTGLEVILTRRPGHMRHHAHQICFPGGRLEPFDTNLKAAALRETEEELGILSQDIEILGALPLQPVLTRFMIQPFVGIVNPKAPLIPDPNEVAEIITVPLNALLQQRNHLQIQRAHKMYPTIHFIPWQQQLIWGATAAIIRRLADQLNPTGQEVYRPVF